jgi:hypothetical protein
MSNFEELAINKSLRPIKDHHFTKFHNIGLDHPLTNKLVIIIFAHLLGNYAKKLFQDNTSEYSQKQGIQHY